MDVFTFLQNNVWLSLMYITFAILILIGGIGGILLLFKKIMKGKKLKFGKGEVEVLDEAADEAKTKEDLDLQMEEKISKHMEAWFDLIPLYDDQRDDINRKVFSIENIEVLKRQMNMAEERVESVIAFMSQVQKKLIADRLENPLEASDHPEVRMYEVRIQQVKVVILDIFRRAMRENHLIEKSDFEFEKYVMDKLEFIFRSVEITVESFYNSDILLIDDLRQAQRDNAKEYQEFIFEVFKEARRLSAWGVCEIARLKKAKKILMHNLRERKVITSDDAIQQAACED